VQCARLATPARAGRDADEALERAAERRFRFVAELAISLSAAFSSLSHISAACIFQRVT
jgi:hypothetical protein